MKLRPDLNSLTKPRPQKRLNMRPEHRGFNNAENLELRTDFPVTNINNLDGCLKSPTLNKCIRTNWVYNTQQIDAKGIII